MLKVNVIVSDEVSSLFLLSLKRFKKYARDILKSCDVVSSDVNIIFVNDNAMASLNEQYKKRKGTTDVLSFLLSEEQGNDVEGEVYISLERAKKQSREYEVPFEEEIVRLVTHGLLHLTGRSHESKEDYTSMVENTEKFIKHYFNQ